MSELTDEGSTTRVSGTESHHVSARSDLVREKCRRPFLLDFSLFFFVDDYLL